MKRRLGILMGAGVALSLSAFQMGCNSHPVSLSTSAGVVEVQQKTNIAGTEELDILWVIDNSGSMCQEQKILRDNFRKFIEELDNNIEFHLAVTTTDMDPSYPLEPVALPGLLQSTPQPVIGFDRTCWYAPDGQGGVLDGTGGQALDLSPIRDAIAAAVECMATPDPASFNFTDAEIQCALPGGDRDACSIPGVCNTGECNEFSIFPDPADYRPIPKVLRAQDYRVGSVIDYERLAADFACMSLVGTRGYGIETGLIAAVEAVSPVNTGGPVNAPEGTMVDTSAPNHGFLRQDARFAAIFVTDENDCSHEGSRQITELGDPTRPPLVLNGCGDQVCDFAAKPGTEATSPLIPVTTLGEQFIANLSASKGRELGPADVFAASIHGTFGPYTGDIPEDCGPMETFAFPTCATVNGTAESGDRYEGFLRTLPVGQFFPEPPANSPDSPLQGFMCQADFSPALQEIGARIGRAQAGCVNETVMPCDGPEDTSCPAFPYSGVPGQCVQMPNTGDQSLPERPVPAAYYCTSGIQVRARLTNPLSTIDTIANSGYCLPDSVGEASFPRGCVVDDSKFVWDACPSGFPGLKLTWNDEQEATNALAGTELQVRYNSVSSDGTEE